MIYTALDIETTGYLKYLPGTEKLMPQNQILSVGYVNFDSESLAIVDAGILYFYRPEFYIESEAQSVHHLTREFLSQFEDVFDENIAKLEALLSNRTIVGKNSNKFDLPYLKAFLKTWANDAQGFLDVIPDTTVDMQEVFAPIYREMYYRKTGIELDGRKKGSLEDYVQVLDPTHSALNAVLEDVAGYVTVEGRDAHDALFDATMTYLVYAIVILRERKQKNGSN